MIKGKTIKANKCWVAILQYFLAFTIPFLIIILSYIGLHISPFGDKTIIISDAKALYMSDLSFIKRALNGQENLLYSFQQGIGLNLMGTHSGILNPANIIVLFFDITAFPSMYSWLIAIDMAVSGFTMFIFLSSVYERRNYNLIFSTVYALIGFNVSYCFHYNFLLSVELLPLIALGIKKIIAGKCPWLYLISLTYTIFASFYFGFMICIASVVLFLMWYVEAKPDLIAKQKKRVWINYMGCSILAGLLPAFMLIPTILSFFGGRANQNSIFDFTITDNMSITETLAKLFIGANDIEELVNGKPNIFCGAFVIFLVMAFFIDKRNSARKKMIHAIPLIFYFITFYVKALSMVMQGFTVTNWFNYRYSFVFSFFLIIIAFEEFVNIREISNKDFKYSCLVFLAVVAIVFSRRYSYVSGGWMLLDLLLLCCCLGAIWWNRIDEKKAPQRVLVILIILLCSIECYVNYLVCTNKLFVWAYNEKEYQQDLFWGSVLSESISTSDPSFYRMANEHHTNWRCNNDPRLFGYNGLNYFGSCEQAFVFQGMCRLGLSWWVNRMWYTIGEPQAFDNLLGLKYVISERDLTKEKGYEFKMNVDKYNIYQNKNALPIGMITTDIIQSIKLVKNPFNNLNNIWKGITGQSEDVFTQESDISFTFHLDHDGETINYKDALEYSTSISKQIETSISNSTSQSETTMIDSDVSKEDLTNEDIINSGHYIECTFVASQDGNIYSYNGASIKENYGINSEPMKYLGYHKKGDIVTDYIEVNSDITLDLMKSICAEYYIGYSNDDILTKYCRLLQDKAGELVKEKDSHLVGNVTTEESGRLFFTIPYDEGWTLTIDGEKVELEKTVDLFMSAKISPGSHTYELKFFPKGMKEGIIISCGALILLLLFICYYIIIRKEKVIIKTADENVRSDFIKDNIEETVEYKLEGSMENELEDREND